MLARVLVAFLGCCSTPAPTTVSNTAPASTRDLLIRGIVLDYADRPVPEARVHAPNVKEVLTDASGHFEIAAPPGAMISASKHDMLGDITVRPGDRDVVIKMMQMPM